MIHTQKITINTLLPGSKTHNLAICVDLLIKNNLYPVPLWASELQTGQLTIVHIGEYGHFFARKTGNQTHEVMEFVEDNLEFHVARLDEAISAGWVRITAPQPTQQRPGYTYSIPAE
jgi:hypothetical protein